MEQGATMRRGTGDGKKRKGGMPAVRRLDALRLTAASLKRCWLLFLVFVFLSAPFLATMSTAYGERSVLAEIQKKKREIQLRHKRAQEERRKLEEINDREREVSHQLREVRGELREVTQSLHTLAATLSQTELGIRLTRNNLAAAKERFSRYQWLLAARLNDIYRRGDVHILGVFMGANSFTDLLDRTYLLGRVVQEDLRLIRKLSEERERIQNAEMKLEKEYQGILTLKKEERRRHSVYAALNSERESLLHEVQGQRREQAQVVVEIEESTAQLESQLRELIRREQERLRPRTARFLGGGRFAWPTNSNYITSRFGYRQHPISGTVKFHTGLDIAADYGAPVYAGNDGIVIYAGWYGGYGYTVILDHGGGVSSLYAHCSSLYVSDGATVRRGQVIAAVGSTGLSTGPHLHFEVRENETPVDPSGRF